jgi:hypothetical protein
VQFFRAPITTPTAKYIEERQRDIDPIVDDTHSGRAWMKGEQVWLLAERVAALY